MADFATSTDSAVQTQLDRLTLLSPGADVLGLSRITTLLDRLGDPHLALPPVFHVAGTNGKGSTCAFLRSALEAQGYRIHSYTSPHLVRFNERIRIAGTLIEDAQLADLLARVLEVAEGVGASFFEVTTAAAFLAFSETPADACVIEVGLGGRLDATNVIVDPAVCGIAQLGLDHQGFLGDTDVAIAREKAGIAKPGRPLVTLAYPDHVAEAVADVADRAGATLVVEGRDWTAFTGHDLRYADASGRIEAPMPSLAGAYQGRNLALAFTMLRHQDRLHIGDAAMIAAATATRWPARMQRLAAGPLTARLPYGAAMWLDGGHNPAAADAVSEALRDAADGQPVHLIAGMLANKDASGFLAPFASLAASFTALPIRGHDCHAPATLTAIARDLGMQAHVADDIESAVLNLPPEARTVAVIGSLYLSGEVLRLNDELPT